MYASNQEHKDRPQHQHAQEELRANNQRKAIRKRSVGTNDMGANRRTRTKREVVEHGDVNFRYNYCYSILWPWSIPWPGLLLRTPSWDSYAALAIGARDWVLRIRGRGTDLRYPLSRVPAPSLLVPCQSRHRGPRWRLPVSYYQPTVYGHLPNTSATTPCVFCRHIH